MNENETEDNGVFITQNLMDIGAEMEAKRITSEVKDDAGFNEQAQAVVDGVKAVLPDYDTSKLEEALEKWRAVLSHHGFEPIKDRKNRKVTPVILGPTY